MKTSVCITVLAGACLGAAADRGIINLSEASLARFPASTENIEDVGQSVFPLTHSQSEVALACVLAGYSMLMLKLASELKKFEDSN
jgi:hypothetical protein